MRPRKADSQGRMTDHLFLVFLVCRTMSSGCLVRYQDPENFLQNQLSSTKGDIATIDPKFHRDTNF